MAKRRSKPTPKKLAEFLERLAETGNVLATTEMLNLDRRALYRLRKEDAEFAAAWDEAMEQAADALEVEARRRALEGWDEPVFYQGEQTGLIRKFSDTLLIFLLKGARPEKYRDRVDHTTKGEPLPGGVVAVNVYLPENGRESEAGE